jgi:hypothetical protein
VSTKYFNVKNGMTTGDLLVSESNVTLGNVSNLHISGGNSGYLLSTDGAGNLSWADASSTQSPAPMPITIDDGNTLTISANYQGLFGTPITVDGTLTIEGVLVDVSGQGAPGSNSQISFNDNGSPGALNGFTINKVSGNLSVPGSVNAGAFLSLAAYSSATLRGIAGTIGQIAVLNDSSPIGMLAFWDQSNSRWCYVYNNSPV